jgi:hypothetical protein
MTRLCLRTDELTWREIIGGGVFGGGGQKKKRESGIEVKWYSGDGDRGWWEQKTKFERKYLAKKRWLFQTKTKFEDRLNMIFVNLTIGAGLLNAGRGPLGEAVQPEAAARSAWSPAKLIHIYTTAHAARN